MGEVKYRFVFEGLQQGTRDVNALGRAMQTVRGGIPGLATAVPRALTGGGGIGQIMQSERYLAQAASELKKMGSLMSAGSSPRTMQSFFNQSLGIGAGQNRMTGQARAAYASFWQAAVPPFVKAAMPINWTHAALGMAAAPFSPWIAARSLNSAFGGKIAGMMGGLAAAGASGIFGAGGFSGFMVAFTALNLAGRALKETFEQLKRAVDEGSKLYQSSARTATPTGQLFQMQSAMAAAGMSPGVIEQMIVRGQHMIPGRGGGTQFPGTNQMVGWASGLGMVSEAQQMRNMSREIEAAWRDSAFDAAIMASKAQQLQNLQASITEVTREWHTMWADIVGNLAPALIVVFNEVSAHIRGWTAMFELWFGSVRHVAATLVGIANAMPSLLTGGIFGGDSFARFMEGYNNVINGTAGGQPGHARVGSLTTNTAQDHAGWARMGFVFRGGFGSHEYGREIAQNTHRMAEMMYQSMNMNTNSNGPAGMPFYNAP